MDVNICESAEFSNTPVKVCNFSVYNSVILHDIVANQWMAINFFQHTSH